MAYFLLCVSVMLGAGKSILSKRVKNGSNGLGQTMKSNAVLFSFAFAVVLILWLITGMSEIKVPLPLALLYALCTLGSQIALMLAVGWGSVAVSSLFYSCGFIIPTVWSCIRYNEGVNALHIIGIVMILVSFVLGAQIKKGEKFNLKWLIAALCGTLFSGLVGIIQKLFASEYPDCSLDVFLGTAFLFIVAISGACFAVMWAVQRKKDNAVTEQSGKSKAVTVLLTASLGIIMGLINKLNTYLSGVLPGIIMFPFANGGVIALTALLGAVIFKEKPTVKQTAAIILGFAAIAVIAVGQNI